MKTLVLTEVEEKILYDHLDAEIQRIKKVGGDPFYTADVVNFLHKLQAVPLVGQPTVLHGAPVSTPAQHVTQPTEANVMPNRKVTPDKDVTIDNIDDLADDLLENDDHGEAKVEKARAKTAH